MTKIEWALELINDGHWHSIDALRNSIDFSEFEINELDKLPVQIQSCKHRRKRTKN